MTQHIRMLLAALALALLCACAPPPAPSAPTQATVPAQAVAPSPAATATLHLTHVAPSAVLAPATVVPPPATASPAPTATAAGAPSQLPGPTTTPVFPEARIAAANLPSLRLLRTVGLGGAVYAAIAPDNTLLAVATTAGVALFELPSLRHLRLDPIPDGVQRVSFSADGRTLLVTTARDEQQLQRRRVADGVLEAAEPAVPRDLYQELLNLDGPVQVRLAVPDSVPVPGVTIIRRADDATIYADDTTLTASISPDGATAALVALDGEVRLVDLATGEVTGEVALHEYWGVGFTPDAQALLTTGRSAWLWNVVEGTLRQGPIELSRVAAGAQYSGEQRVLASADGNTMTVEGRYGYFESTLVSGSGWLFQSGALTPLWQSDAGGSGLISYETYRAAISPARDVIARTEDGVTLELRRGELLLRSLQVPEVVSALVFSSDGSLLAVGDRTGGVRLVPVDGGGESEQGRLGDAVRDLVFSPDGSLLAARLGSGLIEIWRVGEPSTVARVQDTVPAVGPDNILARVEEFLITADNELLIGWGSGSVRFYRLADGALLHTLEEPASEVALGPRRRMLALLQDGRVLLYGIP